MASRILDQDVTTALEKIADSSAEVRCGNHKGTARNHCVIGVDLGLRLVLRCWCFTLMVNSPIVM
jgi:hypothetical protein